MPHVQLTKGDALDVLRGMADESVDSIVTDPPYGLSKEPDIAEVLRHWLAGDDYAHRGGGFMGKKWDSFVPGPSVWKECLRVLKPGGHLLCFAGTRTFDLMGISIRLGGFEIRDTIEWAYGCLTDDAEILTESGWKLGIDVEVDEPVAQWDPETEAITITPVERVFRAPWHGPMVRFTNRDTDQIVTPNHRMAYKVQLRRRTKADGLRLSWPEHWRVAAAEDVKRSAPIRLPLGGEHDGTGIGGTDYARLLGWVWTEGGFDQTPSTGVRIYQTSVNPEHVDEIACLLDNLVPGHKRYDRERFYEYVDGRRPFIETCWFFTGEMADRIRDDLPGKHPTWDLLWRMTQSEKRVLWDAAMKGDGHVGPGKQCFYQKGQPDLDWFQVLTGLTGRSGGRTTMRSAPRSGGQVGVRQRNTTEMQTATLKNASVDYTGDVWCVGVPTGAFVARRNGQMFISMNSGFPKSMNISKAIDKAAGAEREVDAIGSTSCPDFPSPCVGHPAANGSLGGGVMRHALPTTPTTDDAKQWEGWGTALKPAHEPIIMARKPFKGTVAANILTHGTGAINVDASRVGASADDHFGGGAKMSKTGDAAVDFGGGYGSGDGWVPGSSGGRFPANVILTHHDECVEVGTKKVKVIGSTAHQAHHSQGERESQVFKPASTDRPGYRSADGTEEVEAWDCHDDCPVKILDEQSGFLASGKPTRRKASGFDEQGNTSATYGAESRPAGDMMVGYGDTGGASRFFYCVEAEKPESTGLPEGRFPANVILTHHDECVELGMKKVKGSTNHHTSQTSIGGGEIYQGGLVRQGHSFTDTDGKETVEAWDCHDDCPIKMLDEQSGFSKSPPVGSVANKKALTNQVAKGDEAARVSPKGHGDQGGASRFFYCAKAAKSERNAGLVEDMKNTHPTVKPVKLMEYLVRLVTPPGGMVLDPFVGSGTTMIGAVNGGFNGIGIDRDDDGTYLLIAEARITHRGGNVEFESTPDPETQVSIEDVTEPELQAPEVVQEAPEAPVAVAEPEPVEEAPEMAEGGLDAPSEEMKKPESLAVPQMIDPALAAELMRSFGR